MISAALERYRAPRPLSLASLGLTAGDFIPEGTKVLRHPSGKLLSGRIIARELGERRYYGLPGALADYETREFTPRHVYKLLRSLSRKQKRKKGEKILVLVHFYSEYRIVY